MAITLQCEKFPNTTVHGYTRRIGQGTFAGYYRAYVRTVERSAWLTPTINTWKSSVVRPTREDAEADAKGAVEEAARTGYVPAF